MGFGSDGITATWATGFRDCLREGRRVPAAEWTTYPDAIPVITERLRGVIVENRPALKIIKKHATPKCLTYCDPPYPHQVRDGYFKRKHSYRYEMTDDDHRELAKVLHSVPGMVVVSSYASTLYDEELYVDWERVERPTFADGARPRTEVLYLNAPVAEWRKAQRLF